jgi:hypothetical protein
MRLNPARIAVRLALVLAAVLAVALVRVVKSIDVERYRAEAVAWTRQATGRDLTFAGPVKLKLSLHPALTANGVTLANPPGAPRADMIRVDHIEAQIGLLPLLWGDVRVGRVLVDGADIPLDQDGEGRGNWEFAPGTQAEGRKIAPPVAAIRVTQLVFRRVAIHLQTPDDDSLTVQRATLDTDGLAAPIALTLDGQWRGKHLAVTGLLGSLKEVFLDEKPLSLRLKALMPGMVASADGTVRSDKQGLDLALSMTAELNDSADLDPLIGLPLPSLGSARAAFTLSGPLSRPSLSAVEATVGRHDTLAISVKGMVADPLAGTGVDLALGIDGDASAAFGFGTPGKPLPMALSGHVGASGDGEGRSWRVADLKGTLGRSDLTGRFEVSRHNGHAVLDGQFDSVLLDLTRPQQPVATEPGHVLPLDGRLFSDDPLPTHILMSSDGHLVWRVVRLIDRRMVAGTVMLDLDWHEGKLAAQGSAASIGGGRVDGALSLDARVSPPATAIDLSVAHVELGTVLAQLGLSDGLQGARVDLKLKSAGTGESLRALVASQQGSSLLSIGTTEVSSRFTDDGFGAILGRIGGGSGPNSTPWIDMRCLVSHFTLADGLARSEALLFSIGTQTVTGQGSINLASESLDFTLTPRPAGQTPAVQIDLGGTLLHPAVAPARAAYVKNVPGMVSDAASPLMIFAADGNPCFAALAQGRRPTRPVPGGLR